MAAKRGAKKKVPAVKDMASRKAPRAGLLPYMEQSAVLKGRAGRPEAHGGEVAMESIE